MLPGGIEPYTAMSDGAPEPDTEAEPVTLPPEMGMKLSFEEWQTSLYNGIRMLRFDDYLREYEDGTFFRNRENVVDVVDRLRQLPKRAKAGKKSQYTRRGEDYPNWLDDEEKVPVEMRWKMEPDEWLAYENLLCMSHEVQSRDLVDPLTTAVAAHYDKPVEEPPDNLTDDILTEQTDELLRRIQLLPRRSQAGVQSILTRAGVDETVEQFDDYRADEYHGTEVIKDLSEVDGESGTDGP